MHYILDKLFLVLVHYFFLVNYQPLIVEINLPKSEATNAFSFSDVWIFLAKPVCIMLSSNVRISQFLQMWPSPAFAMAKFLLSWLALSVSGGTDYQNLIFR